MRTTSPWLQVIAASTIWGSSGVFVKLLDLSPVVLSFFRMAVPTLVLYLYLRSAGTPILLGDTRLVLLASLLNAVRLLFYFIGYTYTSVGNAVIVLYTWPVIASILGAVVLNEQLTAKKVRALAMALSGVIAVYLTSELSFGSKDFVGISSMLLSAALYATTVVLFKIASAHYTGIQTAFLQNVVGAFAFAPVFLFYRPLPSVTQATVASLYAIMVGAVGFGLFFSALRRITASSASLLSYSEVVSAIAFGTLILGEPITPNMILGGLLIIASIASLVRTSRPDENTR